MPKFLITKCLTWDELSQEQRAKIIDKNRDIRLDWLANDEIIWEFSQAGEIIADAGFLNPDIYYVYDHCQGQGACFDCEIFNWELLLEDLDIPHKQFFINYLKDGSNIEYGIRRPDASSHGTIIMNVVEHSISNLDMAGIVEFAKSLIKSKDT